LAEEKPADERTEAATPRRRQQAREKGDRLASRDLATAMGGLAGVGWLWGWGGSIGVGVAEAMRSGLAIGRADIAAFAPIERALELIAMVGVPLALLGALVLLAAALGQGATGGLGFTPGLLMPKAERMNPLAGLKRLFGAQGLVELAKAVVKAALLLGLTYLLLRQSLPQIAGLSAVPLEAATHTAADLAMRLLLWLSLGLVVIAGVDLPLQLFRWMQRLRMSREDVKEEYKQQEGSPEVRAALRRAARDALKRSSRAAMAEATVVLTNPTHFAVALRYVPEIDSAPVIVARGRGVVAEVIRELAADLGTPMLSYPSVTRALYFTGRVGGLVRPDLYAAVATILAFVLRVSGRGTPPEVEAPASARYDENGRRVAA
jgi:flagellar biosynthetic protein FlhB